MKQVRFDRSKIPHHIAIIMDGNRRWAEKSELPRILGHRYGAEAVREIVRTCGKLGVKVLTLYTFSWENWTRKKQEVDVLTALLEEYLVKEIKELNDNNVRLRCIGRIDALPSRTRKMLDKTITATQTNTGLILNLALSYGGRQEIVDTVNRILNKKVKRIDETIFATFLDTAGLPDPELIIRTSGELRISNFLLWQSAYAELYVTPVLWPEFRPRHLYQAIRSYVNRSRRFGK